LYSVSRILKAGLMHFLHVCVRAESGESIRAADRKAVTPALPLAFRCLCQSKGWATNTIGFFSPNCKEKKVICTKRFVAVFVAQIWHFGLSAAWVLAENALSLVNSSCFSSVLSTRAYFALENPAEHTNTKRRECANCCESRKGT
jgi:hypothetical protein